MEVPELCALSVLTVVRRWDRRLPHADKSSISFPRTTSLFPALSGFPDQSPLSRCRSPVTCPFVRSRNHVSNLNFLPGSLLLCHRLLMSAPAVSCRREVQSACLGKDLVRQQCSPCITHTRTTCFPSANDAACNHSRNKRKKGTSCMLQHLRRVLTSERTLLSTPN